MSTTHIGLRSDVEHSAVSFEQFREELRDALLHLHDPDFVPTAALCLAAGCAREEGAGPVRAQIAAVIQTLEPTAEVPANSLVAREYASLHKRYVLGLTQEETAELMHLSVRHLQRVQAQATDVLAQRLWMENPRLHETRAAQASDWRSQVDLELASLNVNAPNTVADVGETIDGVLELAAFMASMHGVRVEVGHVPPGLAAGVHPSVLRQTLITAIGWLAQHLSSQEMELHATLEDGRVKITVSGTAAAGPVPLDQDLAGAIIAPPETSVEVQHIGDGVFLQIKMPCVGERTVLVVEDNPDMVHFYRRCTAGTTYRIVNVPPGQPLFDAIEATSPDVVVLDVMLPDTDGWQLLTHLHERPATRTLPVIVCSVVKEESLALALGAATFLAKPIAPQRFVEALDQVLLRAATTAPIAPESSAAVS